MLSGVLWVALARLILGLAPLLTLPAMTGAFPPAWYGVWTQIAVTNSFIVPLVGMGFDTGVVRFFASGFGQRDRVRDFYSMALFIVLVSLGLAGIAFIWAPSVAFFMFSDSGLAVFAMLTFVWVLTQSLYNYSLAFFRVRNRMRTFAFIDLLNGTSAALIMVLIPSYFHSVQLMVELLAAAQITLVLAVWIVIYRTIGFAGVALTGLKPYLKFGLPLVPNSLFLWLVNSSGRYFLTHFGGLKEVGVYAAGYTIANTMTLFFMPISIVLFPVISKLWEDRQVQEVALKIGAANRWYLMLALPGAFGLSLLAGPLMALLSAKEFAAGASVIFLLTLANLFYGLYQINLYGTLLLKKNTRLTGLFAGAGVLNTVLNLILVPPFGLRGTALATLFSFGFLAATVSLWSKKELKFSLNWRATAKTLGSALGMAAVLEIWQLWLPPAGVWGLAWQVPAGAAVYVLLMLGSGAVKVGDLKVMRGKK